MSGTLVAVVTPPSYKGLRIFEPYFNKANFSVDQGNFVVGQVFALLYAFIFRNVNDALRLSVNARHWNVLISGLLLCFFCNGTQLNHLLLMAVISYITLCACGPQNVHKGVMTVSLLYLGYLHLTRQLEEYGGYYIDITGPAMIIVQKVTSLAFNIHDGMCKNKKLTDVQNNLKVTRIPSLLEYMGFVFSFFNVLCGPYSHFNDYISFIEGTNFAKCKKDVDSNELKKSLRIAILKKLSIVTFFAIMLLTYCPKFSMSRLADEKFLSSNPTWFIVFYMMASTAGARFKYYFAWIFGEVVCNASGLGYNGVDKNGKPKWDLLNPLDILKFEFSTNLREALDAWNKPTQTWLKKYAYERSAPRYKTLVTYLLSAFWHGFYPGYYLTFLSGALFTLAARISRRKLRYRFQGNKYLSKFYDLVTCIFTRFMMAYLVSPFILLSFTDSIRLYSRLYFYGHVISLIGYFVLPIVL